MPEPRSETSLELLASLEPLLDRALELDPEERQAWLAELRVERPDLAGELERLLAAEEQLDQRGFLDLGAAGPLSAGGGGGLTGLRVGAYTLERLLGQGGMGTVWLARRTDGRFEGDAAVKLLNLALLDPVGSERFRREGTLLARVNHPHIARLLDAGVTDGGQPYLVLERVEGERIDRYCDAHRLSPARRIELMLDVLSAVGHAHANLIVHRDIKPSNILVAADGAVKLLDFGIAKLLDDDATAGRSTLTDSGGIALTPEYAAPEQARGGAVTTGTDVYALGVLLYQLLSGRHPTGEACRSAAEHLRAITEIEPRRLSAAVGPGSAGEREARADNARARGSTPDRLSRLYLGDLDNIVAKAIKKDPAERYATVGELADDLRRHLAHEPVRARPDSLGYRMGKFVRRNRAVVAAALVALVSLVAATLISLAQLQEARRQRDAAVAESRRRAAMADVQSVLAGDSRGAGGRSLSVLERIELAERVLKRKYRAEPDVVVEVMAELSNRLVDMSDMRGHAAVLERARSIALRADLPAQLALVDCLRLASLIWDEHFDSARAVLAEARAAYRRAPSPGIDIQCLNAEGQLLVATGAADSAVVLHRRAVALAGDQEDLASVNDLANALRAAGRAREAAHYQEHILLELDSTGYADTDIYPTVLGFLVATQSELGEFRRLDSATRIYIQRLEATQGSSAIDVGVATMYGLTKLRKGDLDSAAFWLGIARRDTTTSGEFARVAWLAPAWAQLLVEQGRFEEAARTLPDLSTDTPTRRFNAALLRARITRATGNPDRARMVLDSALGADIRLPRPPSYLVYGLLTGAEWRMRDGRGAEADSLARLALAGAALDSLAGFRSAHVGRAELVRARAALAAGDSAAALAAARRAAPALEAGFGVGHPQSAEAEALLDSLASRSTSSLTAQRPGQ